MVERFYEWHRSAGRERVNPAPLLPWPVKLANWLLDPVATALAGKVQFKRPYPRPLLSEEMRWNGFLLEAMAYVIEADSVFSKPPENWGDTETKFARRMLEQLTEAGFPLLTD